MKLALCLHGYMSNPNGLHSFKAGYNYIYDKIIKGNDVDIFVHCWEAEQKNYYNLHYGSKTVTDKFEKQKTYKNTQIWIVHRRDIMVLWIVRRDITVLWIG